MIDKMLDALGNRSGIVGACSPNGRLIDKAVVATTPPPNEEDACRPILGCGRLVKSTGPMKGGQPWK
jgi:hypothetical protein